jgi:hypothetical protein
VGDRRDLPAAQRRQRRGLRPYVTAGVVVTVGASFIAIPPAAAVPEAKIREVSMATRLTASSIANVPLNLINALASAPGNEILALNQMAAALLFADNWYAPSAANIWGIDPGDPPKIAALAAVLVPFPAMSKPLGDQLNGLLAAEIPVTESCALNGCPPLVVGPYGPPEPITGVDWLDRGIWTVMILTGARPFPLLNNLFRVPLTELMAGYTFDSTYPGYTNANSGPFPSGFGFAGTKGPDNLVPWADTTFTLNPLLPVTNFVNSLMAEPTGITTVTPQQVIDTFVSLFAAQIVAFNVFAPGSPGCPSPCTGPFTTQSIMQGLSTLFPGNVLIREWLDRGPVAPVIEPAPPTPVSTLALRSVQEGVDQHFVAPGGDTLVDNGIQQEDPHGLTALQVKSLHTGVAGTEPIQPTPGIDEQQSLQTPPTEQPGPELETQQPDPGLATQKPDPKPETPKTGASSSNPVPSGTGGRHRQPDGGLTDALKSATDQTNSSISKVTGALTGKAPSTHPAPSTPDDTKKGDTAPGAKPNDANE